MKKNEVAIGGVYLAKVSNNVVAVRIDNENRHGGWDATNLATGKKVRIKSAQRLRGVSPERDVAQAQADSSACATGSTPATNASVAANTQPQRNLGCLDAAYQVLTEAGVPMRCGDVVEKMLSDGLWKTGGKTPAATIYATIVREISTKGAASRFRKTDRGLFTTNAN